MHKRFIVTAVVLMVMIAIGAGFTVQHAIAASPRIGPGWMALSSPFLFLSIVLSILLCVTCAAWILRTEQYLAAEQLDADRTAFLRLTMHQLGMPLATFKWWMEVLREKDNGAICKEDKACDQLQEGITRLDQIINTLRDASNLHDIQVDDEPQTYIVLTDVFDDVEKQTAMQRGHRQQHILVDIPHTPPRFSFNKKLLTGVLRELVENASFYSPQGSEIVISARTVHRRIQIDVEDHGHGIPRDELSMIFGKFKRASNAVHYKPAGNGLGLFIAKDIIEREGGTMWIKSELDKGTIVSLTLPTS